MLVRPHIVRWFDDDGQHVAILPAVLNNLTYELDTMGVDVYTVADVVATLERVMRKTGELVS